MMRLLALLALVVPVCSCGGYAQERGRVAAFGQLVEQLSEPGGYFDTDNLISNERSYLHVLPTLQRLGVRGGAYVGVGPDQNFSYIAAIEPAIAYIVDIRRDNMLLHLMFKAMFELAPTRVEYLGFLLARPTPADLADWSDASVDALIAYMDSVVTRSSLVGLARARVDSSIATFGVRLSDDDWQTIDRFHRVFIREGLSLRFTSYGRSARFYYPTYRDLLREVTVNGAMVGFLTSAARYETVRDLQLEDRIIPVVGDLAGPDAVKAIGTHAASLGVEVSAYYTSNVEFYLFQAGTFDAFVENVEALPRGERSVVIRSLFRNPGGAHPKAVQGYYSTQMLQTIDDLVGAHSRGEIRNYWELVMRYVPD